jgi:hypothetical protein
MSEGVRTLPSPISLTDFDVGVTLGTGSFGRVRFATHKVLLYCKSLPSATHRIYRSSNFTLLFIFLIPNFLANNQ